MFAVKPRQSKKINKKSRAKKIIGLYFFVIIYVILLRLFLSFWHFLLLKSIENRKQVWNLGVCYYFDWVKLSPFYFFQDIRDKVNIMTHSTSRNCSRRTRHLHYKQKKGRRRRRNNFWNFLQSLQNYQRILPFGNLSFSLTQCCCILIILELFCSIFKLGI